MAHKCFISYKTEDAFWKDELKSILRQNGVPFSVIEERIDSHDSEYVIRYIREHGLSDSSVTIFLIGQHSSENEGMDILGYEKNYFIQRELQASLYDGKGNRQSGLLGVVLPEMTDKIFGSNYPCLQCGGTHEAIYANDTTLIREFWKNYYMEEHAKPCCWSDDEQYCVLVRWSDFIRYPLWWIDKAFSKKESPVAEKVVVHTLR